MQSDNSPIVNIQQTCMSRSKSRYEEKYCDGNFHFTLNMTFLADRT